MVALNDVTKLFYMNILVSNVSHSATDFQLNKLFSAFGEVTSAKIALDELTEESKGFGWVLIEDLKAAQNAIQSLDGSLFLGMEIQVSEAKATEEITAEVVS